MWGENWDFVVWTTRTENSAGVMPRTGQRAAQVSCLSPDTDRCHVWIVSFKLVHWHWQIAMCISIIHKINKCKPRMVFIYQVYSAGKARWCTQLTSSVFLQLGRISLLWPFFLFCHQKALVCWITATLYWSTHLTASWTNFTGVRMLFVLSSVGEDQTMLHLYSPSSMLQK